MSDVIDRLENPRYEDPVSDAQEEIIALRAEKARTTAENERLGRDYNTARDAHDRRVRELDAHCIEVAALRAENERLRAVLRDIAKVTRGWEPGVWSEEEGRKYFSSLFFGAQEKARAALTPTSNGQKGGE